MPISPRSPDYKHRARAKHEPPVPVVPTCGDCGTQAYWLVHPNRKGEPDGWTCTGCRAKRDQAEAERLLVLALSHARHASEAMDAAFKARRQADLGRHDRLNDAAHDIRAAVGKLAMEIEPKKNELKRSPPKPLEDRR